MERSGSVYEKAGMEKEVAEFRSALDDMEIVKSDEIPVLEVHDTIRKMMDKPIYYNTSKLDNFNHISTAMDIMNADGMESWTAGAGVRYRSRRDLLEIGTNPAFEGRHEFKVASMAKTIAFPVDPFNYLGDPRLVLALLLGLTGCGLSWFFATRRQT